MTEMHFDTAPKANWLGVLLTRKPGLAEGQTLPRFSARLDGMRADILEDYRAVCGFPEGPNLPLPLPQVVAAPLHIAIFTHKDFPLPAMGLVHVSSRIIQHQPIPADAQMDVHCWMEGHRQARKGIEVGSLTLHPQGIPHGPHPGTIEKSLGATFTNELAVRCDTFKPLFPTRAALDLDDSAYPASWEGEHAPQTAGTHQPDGSPRPTRNGTGTSATKKSRNGRTRKVNT